MADALQERAAEILAGNAEDVAQAEGGGTSSAMVDRLRLTEKRIAGMADGLRNVAGLPDPVGEVVRGYTLPNGLEVSQRRVPLGVVGIIYEARPNVTADAAGLCVKSGNAVLLRGSSSAARSNAAIVTVLRDVLEKSEPAGRRDPAGRGWPRRGETPDARSRSRRRAHPSRRRRADPQRRRRVDGARDRDRGRQLHGVRRRRGRPGPSPRRSSSTRRRSGPASATRRRPLLVHADVAEQFLPTALKELQDAGVTVHGDDRVRAYERRGRTRDRR